MSSSGGSSAVLQHNNYGVCPTSQLKHGVLILTIVTRISRCICLGNHLQVVSVLTCDDHDCDRALIGNSSSKVCNMYRYSTVITLVYSCRNYVIYDSDTTTPPTHTMIWPPQVPAPSSPTILGHVNPHQNKDQPIHQHIHFNTPHSPIAIGPSPNHNLYMNETYSYSQMYNMDDTLLLPHNITNPNIQHMNEHTK